MKKLVSIFAITAITAFNSYTVLANINNTVESSQLISEECLSDEEIMRYVRKIGYSNPVIIDEIGCDRIVETTEALLYVKVAGGRIVGAEIIGN
jgi:hypothetical protein